MTKFPHSGNCNDSPCFEKVSTYTWNQVKLLYSQDKRPLISSILVDCNE